MSVRNKAYAYASKARSVLGMLDDGARQFHRAQFLAPLIEQAAHAVGVADWSATLLKEVCGNSFGELVTTSKTGQVVFSDGVQTAPFDVGNDPGLIGWCYQAWNQAERDKSTWAISKRETQLHESAHVPLLTQLFTDEYLSDFLIKRCISLVRSENSRSEEWPLLCDPACGVGHMLLAAVKSCSQHMGASPAVLDRVYGFDIDASAVALARALIFLQCIACGYSADPDDLWSSLKRTVVVLPEPYGALDRAALQILPHQQFDVVITNPPFLGRRKLSTAMRNFLDLEYPAARVDLCAAFMQRCIELCVPGGAVGLVTTDKWIRLRGYEQLRNGLGSFRGLLGEVSLDVVCELGARAFHPSAELHDGVKTALLSARRCQPAKEHSFALCNLSEYPSYEEKIGALGSCPEDPGEQGTSRTVKQSSWREQGAASMLLAVSGLPQPLTEATSTVGRAATVVVGIQTNDDQSYVKYVWQVPPEREGWRVHLKGGGYARWCGLNRWVINWQKGAAAFFKTQQARTKAEQWVERSGWCYSWFANGALGLRYKESGWSFGRAASSGVFCDDLRLVAFLNSRFPSIASRAIGGKIQLPEGVVRGLPIPQTLEPISEDVMRLVLELRKEITRGDPRDALYDPNLMWEPSEGLILEALALLAEGILEMQVERSLGMTRRESHEWGLRHGVPVGCLQPRYPIESHPLWSYMPKRLTQLRHCIVSYGDYLPRVSYARDPAQRELFSSEDRSVSDRPIQSYAIPSTGLVEQWSRQQAANPFDVVFDYLQEIDAGPVVRRDVQLGEFQQAIACDILKQLGHRWWSQRDREATASRSVALDAKALTTIIERREAQPCYQGIVQAPPLDWLMQSFIPWQQRLFCGVSPIAFHGVRRGSDGAGLWCEHSQHMALQ